MPYIDERDRSDFAELVDELHRTGTLFDGPGDLSYVIAQVIATYLDAFPCPKYTWYNDVLGVLAGLQMEVYRRLVGPYEDQKLEQHGDVFNVPTPMPPRPMPDA